MENMDLIIIFSFISLVILIITTGIILFPISRKLGLFLEQAAKDRANRLASGQPASISSPVSDQLVQLMSSLESQVGHLAERQAFTERLLEGKAETDALREVPGARGE